MTLSIAPLTSPEQIHAVMAVERECFTNPWTEAMYLAELARPDVSRFLLATIDGHLVGVISYWLVLDELHINNLAVLPAHRRTGIATALLARLLDEGQRDGVSRVFLEVRESNDAARQLYERAGFAVTQTRREYYSQPTENALVLMRTIGTSSGA